MAFRISSLWPAVLVMVLTHTAFSMLDTVRVFMIEQAFCHTYYSEYDPEMILTDGSVPEEECKLESIQADVAVLLGCFHIATLFPSLLAAPVYTRLASVMGKKSVLFINACGFTLAICYYNMICYFDEAFSIWMVLLTPVFDLIGGGPLVRETLIYTYIAESVDSESLSNRLYLLSTLLHGMSFIGTFFGSQLMKVDPWLPAAIGMCLFSLTIFAVCYLPGEIKILPSVSLWSQYSSLSQSEGVDSADESINRSSDHGHANRTSSSWRRILRAITGHISSSISPLREALRDPFTRLAVLVFFSNGVAMSVQTTFKQWVSSGFNWTLAEVQEIASFDFIVAAAVLFSLPFISNALMSSFRVTKLDVDCWVTWASTLVKLIGVLGIGLAPSGGLCLFSLMIYSLGRGLGDALRSVVTSAMEDEESIKRLYMGIGMAQEMARVVGTPLWTSIFYATLQEDSIFPAGSQFLGAVAVFALSLIMAVRLRRGHVPPVESIHLS